MVYAVQETVGGTEYACKVVSKTTLVKARAQSKMLTEINIHRAVSCGHVVRFVRCFEDDANVYILMELCSNRTLADVVKKRGAMREEEAACYLREVLAATAHLHAMRVIHRDLKLGNLFLTAEGLAEVEKDGPGTDPSLGRDAQSCRIKIGDFGLACSLENDSQRRKTVCGTPNYIAPEVLMGKQGVGHSYEVDTWSMGVILYTLVYGTPPFQTKDVKLTYKRIRANEYEFPAEPAVSESTKQLIRAALSADPARRPSLLEMSRHELLQKGAEGWVLSDEKPNRTSSVVASRPRRRLPRNRVHRARKKTRRRQVARSHRRPRLVCVRRCRVWIRIECISQAPLGWRRQSWRVDCSTRRKWMPKTRTAFRGEEIRST